MSRELGRFLRFSVVGAIGAVVDFGVFNLLRAGLGVSEVPASIVSFLAAVSSNFLWNRVWTYPDSRSKPLRRQATQFIAVSLIGLALRTPILAALLAPAAQAAVRLKALWPALPLSAGAIGANLALAAAVVIVLFWNFFANRYWTYNDVEGSAGRLPPDRRPV